MFDPSLVTESGLLLLSLITSLNRELGTVGHTGARPVEPGARPLDPQHLLGQLSTTASLCPHIGHPA
ncbi:hypothetical protein AAFF_G00079070 [Aldrovandia affinis]|uniref:Uncharacterized protein n=1 Tax=Aldrovandia affinis TaxID=143900 RepID=A0AAD7RXA0_9TELE|nr:hypothetical protein AAFF_G00079070 [Aldrovandia affinis]